MFSSDDRIQLSLGCQLCKIPAVFVQHRRIRLSIPSAPALDQLLTAGGSFFSHGGQKVDIKPLDIDV